MRTFNVYTPDADFTVLAANAYAARRMVYYRLYGRVPFDHITAIPA